MKPKTPKLFKCLHTLNCMTSDNNNTVNFICIAYSNCLCSLAVSLWKFNYVFKNIKTVWSDCCLPKAARVHWSKLKCVHYKPLHACGPWLLFGLQKKCERINISLKLSLIVDDKLRRKLSAWGVCERREIPKFLFMQAILHKIVIETNWIKNLLDGTIQNGSSHSCSHEIIYGP